jgi:hypothetical protein
MSNNPLVLTIRFLLELAALAALAYWGLTQHEGLLRVLLAVGLPLLAATLWGTFRVSGYPNKAPIEVPGLVRLLLEFVIFGNAAGLHYGASYDYILALLKLQ